MPLHPFDSEHPLLSVPGMDQSLRGPVYARRSYQGLQRFSANHDKQPFFL